MQVERTVFVILQEQQKLFILLADNPSLHNIRNRQIHYCQVNNKYDSKSLNLLFT